MIDGAQCPVLTTGGEWRQHNTGPCCVVLCPDNRSLVASKVTLDLTDRHTMFLPLIFLPALVSSEGILDNLFRPLMTQLDGVAGAASHLLSQHQQQTKHKGLPGDFHILTAPAPSLM